MTFQRARSEEQRTIRRQVILDTAVAMLGEMPVGEVSLNELSRRVGLAKSNVLRYFESREAVLLELLDRAWKQWTIDLSAQLAAGVDRSAPVEVRGEQFAAVLAASVIGREILCDLFSAQAGVLEHNVSPQVAARYKHAALANVGDLAALTRLHLPELEVGADRLCAAMIMSIGAIWTHSRPSQAVLAAYEADPSLAAMRMDLPADLRELLATLVAGMLTRRRITAADG
ncbi:TetR family transcriptional regulator [Herbidospora sp. RD11066]